MEKTTPSKTSKLAIVDIDGTLFFTEANAAAAASRMMGKDVTYEETRAFSREVKQAVHKLSCTEYDHLSIPNKKMIEKVRELRDDGFTIVILSARDASVMPNTIALLKQYGIEYDQIYHSTDPSVDFKDFKAAMLKKLADGYERVEVYEDRGSIINHMRDKVRSDKVVFYQVGPAGLLRA